MGIHEQKYMKVRSNAGNSVPELIFMQRCISESMERFIRNINCCVQRVGRGVGLS
jgi:hypothetical protein